MTKTDLIDLSQGKFSYLFVYFYHKLILLFSYFDMILYRRNRKKKY